MPHVLEKITSKETTFSAAEIVESELTGLLARMFDYAQLLDEPNAKVIEGWRNEIYQIRRAGRIIWKTT